MLTDTIAAVLVPHQMIWNDHHPTEQIQDFIANCVHSVCVFIREGGRKSRHGIRQTFFVPQIQQIGYMKNTHKFYVANPQNPSVDVWFTRDQRANFHICTVWCKDWCSSILQQRCPTLLEVEDKFAYQWLLNKQPAARTSCHIVPTHFHIPHPKFQSKTRFESIQIKHREHLKRANPSSDLRILNVQYDWLQLEVLVTVKYFNKLTQPL